jgi:hypothetical protein
MRQRPSDPMEAIIYDALKKGDILFQTEEQTEQRLDFYLPAYDIHIEVKRMHTPRIAEQMSRADNVIAVQGKAAVEWLARTIVQSDGPREE